MTLAWLTSVAPLIMLMLSPMRGPRRSGGKTPWIKLYPAGAGVSLDWCLRARGTTYNLRASSSAARSNPMGKIIERCAGIDVGKRFLFCCVLTGAANEEPHSQTLRFDATVPAL